MTEINAKKVLMTDSSGNYIVPVIDPNDAASRDLDNLSPTGEAKLGRKVDIRVGDPIPTLSDELPENAIWLEGAIVNKIDYPGLFAVYGNTYGTITDDSKFQLPDLRNKVLWGGTESDFGYLEAGLPNITGGYQHIGWNSSAYWGAVWGGYTVSLVIGKGPYGNTTNGMKFDASKSNSIYGKSSTVQPPSLKVRFYTYYA